MRRTIALLMLVAGLGAHAGSNFTFVSGSNVCAFPSITPLARFRADQYTGTGASLSLTKLGSEGSAATVPGGITAPTIVAGAGPNGTPVVRFTSADTYMTFGTDQEIVNGTAAHDVWVVAKYAGTVGSGSFETLLTYCVDDNVAAKKAQSVFASNTATYEAINWAGGDGTTASTVVGINGFNYSSAFFSLLIQKTGTGNYNTAASFDAFKNQVAQTEVANTGVTNSVTCINFLGAYTTGFPITPNADVAEWIVAAPGSRAAIDSYISCRYGL